MPVPQFHPWLEFWHEGTEDRYFDDDFPPGPPPDGPPMDNDFPPPPPGEAESRLLLRN